MSIALSWFGSITFPTILSSRRIVRPETIIRWHRQGFRAYWRWKSRGRCGRPWIHRELRDLIERMSIDNTLWGAPRIHGELLKLGFTVAQSTWLNTSVAAEMVAADNRGRHFYAIRPKALPRSICLPSRPPLRAALCLRHLKSCATADRLSHRDGTAKWPMARSAVDGSFPWETAPKILIRDNDAKFCPVFKRRIRAMGIRDHPVAFRSPWQNGYVERLIGTIRRECLDHMILVNEAHLRPGAVYLATYYNYSRTHRSLAKDAPYHRSVERNGPVTAHPILAVASQSQKSNIRYRQDNRHAERDQETHSAPQIHRLNGLRV